MLLTVGPAGGSEPLTLKVTPATSFAPATMWVRARMEPSASNRSLEIVADGENFYRSSIIPLDGEQAPRLIELNLKAVPSGHYEIVAILTDASGNQRAVARQPASVIGFD
jgi:hypothetical protein